MRLKFLPDNFKFQILILFLFFSISINAQIANQTIDTITNNTINEYLDNQAMTIDAANTVHLVFRRDSSGINILKYTKRECSNTWTTPITISAAGDNVFSYAIEAAPSGQLFVAYEAGANNGNIKLATETGGMWSVSSVTNNGSLNMDVAIAIDGDNNVHLAWITTNSSNDNKIAYSTNMSGAWVTQVLAGPNLGAFGTGAAPNIAVTPGGVAHITYRSAAYSDYKVEKTTNGVAGGSTWTIQLIPSPMTINYDGIIVIDEDSTIHVALNGNNGFGPGFSPSTYYTKQLSGSNTWSTAQSVDVGTNGSVFGMDIDNNGYAHIVYEEVNSNIITGAILYSTNAGGSAFVDTFLLNNLTSYGGVIRLNNDGVKYIGAFSNDIGVDNEIFVIRNGLCTVPPQMPIADFSADKTVICAGDTITFTDLSTGPPTSRAWTFNGGTPGSSTTTSPKVVYNVAGVYDVTLSVTNSVGTDAETKTGYITVLAAPLATAGEDAIICAGGSAQLFAQGGVTYRWSPASGLSDTTIHNPIASPAATTNYIVTVTGSNGCKAKDTLKVTVNPLPNVDAGNNKLICAGSSTQLAATGASTYIWSPAASLSNPNISNPVATPSVTTTYTVTGTSVNGCFKSDTVKITVIAAPVANAGADVTYCSGTGVQLNASGGTSYSWSPSTGLSATNIANPLASPAVATQYVVTVFNSSGCSAKDTVNVSVAAPPVATASADVIACAGTATTITATGGNSYSWSPATGLNNATIQSPSATPTATTIYTVTVSDANGCTATDEVQVTVNPLPAANAGPDVIICTGASAQLNASGGATYSWSPAATLSNPSIANPVATPNFTTNYIVTVTGINNCVKNDTVKVTVDPAVVATANNDTTICAGQPVQMKANGGDIYTWQPTTGLSNPNISNPVAVVTATTNYMVIVAKNNCLPDTAYVVLTVNPAPVVTFSPTSPVVCAGSSVQLNASGGTTYNWSPATGLNNPNIANPVASPAVTSTYTVTATNGDGCSGINTLTVTVSAAPAVSAGNDVTICNGETVALTATGAANYTWAPATIPNPNTATINVNPANTTTFTVTGTAANGCSNTDTVTVFVQPALVVGTSNDTSICAGGSAQLMATGGTTYSWTPSATLNNPNIANPIGSPTTTTTYNVVVNNGICQPGSAKITVTVNPNPVTPMINQSGNVLSVNNTYNYYQWYLNGNIINGATGATHTITQAGNYTVVVQNEFGCSATSAVFYAYGVGIDEMADGNKLHLFGYGKTVIVKFEKPVNNYSISILNVIGEEIYWNENINDQHLDVNLDKAAAGIYLISINVKGYKIVRKVHLN